MSRFLRAITALAALALALSAIGCGGDDGASQQEIDAAKTEAAAQQKLKDKQAQLEKELSQLKKDRAGSSKSSGSSGSGGSTAAPPSTASTCGGGVSAGANTSCAFALNTASEYFRADGGSPTISVYSPVTQQTYTMTCTAGAPTVCRGGNNAVVYIR